MAVSRIGPYKLPKRGLRPLTEAGTPESIPSVLLRLRPAPGTRPVGTVSVRAIFLTAFGVRIDGAPDRDLLILAMLT